MKDEGGRLKVFGLWPLALFQLCCKKTTTNNQKPKTKDLQPSAFILHPSFVTINRIQQRA